MSDLVKLDGYGDLDLPTALDHGRAAIAAARDDMERCKLRDEAERLRLLGQAMERKDIAALASVLMREVEDAWVAANPPTKGNQHTKVEVASDATSSFTRDQQKRMREAARCPEPVKEQLKQEALEQGVELTQQALCRAAKLAANTEKPPNRKHPATYTDGLLPMFASLLGMHLDTGTPRVLDPMCGEGSLLKLSSLIDDSVVVCSDIIRWEHADPAVAVCDAQALPHPDGSFDAVITSPPYGNKMAQVISKDGDERYTYADRRGADAAPGDASGLHWGDEYRRVMAAVWVEAVRVTRPGGLIVVNCKDHSRGNERQPVTGWHAGALNRLGCALVDVVALPAGGHSGLMHGELRASAELALAFRVPPRLQSRTQPCRVST